MFNIEINGGESIKIKFLFSTGNYQKSFSTTPGTCLRKTYSEVEFSNDFE